MRRLLLISYFFAPEPSAGALRPGALAKFLPAHGWEIDLLTRSVPPKSAAARIASVPHRPWIERLRHDLGMRPDVWFGAPAREHAAAEFVKTSPGFPARAWNLFRSTGLQAATWPDRTIDWLWQTHPQMSALVRERPPDAILSTSPPETVHFVARAAQRISGAPWIADLRDPWSNTHLMARAAWRNRLDAATERRVFSTASTLITVSPPIAEELRGLHMGARVRTIENGFDPDAFPGPAPADRSRFTVLYSGSLTFGRHDIATFLDGARRFLAAHPGAPLRLRFLGETSPVLRAQIGRFGLEAQTTLEERAPHGQAVAAMRSAPVLLFLPWQDPAHPGVYSSKLFEYLGARRPVLAVGSEPGESGAILVRAGAGKLARDAEQTAQLLGDLYRAHLSGHDAWVAEEAAIARYSHLQMVRRFAEELDRVTDRAAH